MGRRGHPPVPTAIKELNGNPGRRPLNKREPKPKRGIPRCPSWLPELAKKYWKETTRTLDDMGVLTEAELHLLVLYCHTWARWRECQDWIEKHGSVMVIRHPPSGERGEDGKLIPGEPKYMQQAPQVSIARHLQLFLLRCEIEFGMSPTARTRIQVDKPDETASSLLKFIASKPA